jgi:hypothetical protein
MAKSVVIETASTADLQPTAMSIDLVLENTVTLDGSLCGCAPIAFGGCSRNEFVYWREIWLRRAGGSQEIGAS